MGWPSSESLNQAWHHKLAATFFVACLLLFNLLLHAFYGAMSESRSQSMPCAMMFWPFACSVPPLSMRSGPTL